MSSITNEMYDLYNTDATVLNIINYAYGSETVQLI